MSCCHRAAPGAELKQQPAPAFTLPSSKAEILSFLRQKKDGNCSSPTQDCTEKWKETGKDALVQKNQDDDTSLSISACVLFDFGRREAVQLEQSQKTSLKKQF